MPLPSCSTTDSNARSRDLGGWVRSAWASRTALVRNLAAQDVIVLAFLCYLTLLSLSAPPSVGTTISQRFAFGLLSAVLVTVALVRGELLPQGPARFVLYRVGLYAPAVGSYFLIGYLNPALGHPLLDPALLTIDEALFTVTPTVWLQRFNQPAIIEWFAFFYYSYFYIMALMTIPALFFGKGRRQLELLFGTLVVACVGHLGYTLVPGFGPYHYLEFESAVAGGFWWDQVLQTVLSSGAMMDIFPSLHTAYPTYFALYAFGQRDDRLHRWLWPILAFFAANIIVATLLLRWHWGIDVIAGLLLAVFARQLSIGIARREVQRARSGRQPVWERWTPHPKAQRAESIEPGQSYSTG